MLLREFYITEDNNDIEEEYFCNEPIGWSRAGGKKQ